MPTIKIVSDSVCDVPADIIASHDIGIMPAVVNVGSKSYLDDGIDLPREKFFELLPTMDTLPTTSATPLGVARDVISKAAQMADHLIIITTPEKFSAIHNNARLAAEELIPGRFTMIDSGQVTMGEGFQVILAAEMAAAGEKAAEIEQAVRAMSKRTYVYGALSTLDNLRKSGRVGWTTAIAGRLLNIKPIVELTQGDVKSLDNIRTFKRALQRLVGYGLQCGKLERLAILHSGNLEGVQAVKDGLASVFDVTTAPVVMVNTGLGTHVAAGAVGLAIVTEQ